MIATRFRFNCSYPKVVSGLSASTTDSFLGIMTDTNIASTTTPQAAIPAPVADQAAPIQATATPTASVTATAAAATAAVNSPAMNGGGEQLPCQWVGCTEKSPTAEALYVR